MQEESYTSILEVSLKNICLLKRGLTDKNIKKLQLTLGLYIILTNRVICKRNTELVKSIKKGYIHLPLEGL